jgi:hypothetical protein
MEPEETFMTTHSLCTSLEPRRVPRGELELAVSGKDDATQILMGADFSVIKSSVTRFI